MVCNLRLARLSVPSVSAWEALDNRIQIQNNYQVREDVNYRRGLHSFKMGVARCAMAAGRERLSRNIVAVRHKVLPRRTGQNGNSH